MGLFRHTTQYPSFISRLKDMFSFKRMSFKEALNKKLTLRTWSIVVTALMFVGIGFMMFGKITQIYKQASGADPVNYWKFDAGSGTYITDSIPSGMVNKCFISTVIRCNTGDYSIWECNSRRSSSE